MIHLVTQHGTGDTYMTLAFARALERVRQDKVAVHIKMEHKAIAAMFPDVSAGIELLFQDHPILFQCHPSARHGLDISRFAYLDRPPSHADLWRAMLDLPLDEPMVRGLMPAGIARHARKVFLIPESRSWRPQSWPNEFTSQLNDRLSAAGWGVYVNSPVYSLADVLWHCFSSDWVIGIQCGLMAIITHALFPCRKTFVTPPSEVGHDHAMPVWRFSGEDYDVEEVGLYDTASALDQIMCGPNAQGLPYKTFPMTSASVRLSPGDFFDRWSVLEIKMQRLRDHQRAAFVRDYLRHCELAGPIIRTFPAVAGFYADLLRVNKAAWDHNDKAVPDALAHREMQASHAEAIRMNRERVRLKNVINEICGSGAVEFKSYYEGGKA